MKLKKTPELVVETVGKFDSQEFDIPPEEVGMLLTVLASGIYADKIGSPIREVVSNAYDAQIEKGNIQEPIMVGIHYEDGETLFKVKDVGIGMSPDRIHNIFTKYFKSTKRDSNDQIGGFGLGAKSPLTYCDTFFVTTIFDNIKYSYAVHKADSETMKPSMKLLYDEPTEDSSGTEISFHINDDEDIPKFVSAVRRQLLYFPNIYYINCNVENDYRIYEGKSFLFTDQFGDQLGKVQSINAGSNAPVPEEGEFQNENKIMMMPYKNMHISIGNVAYPLNCTLAGIDDIALPIALKFQIGELTVNTSRESIEYTSKSIEMINIRHQEFLTEIAELWKIQMGEGMDNVFQFIQAARVFAPILRLGRAKINVLPLMQFLEFDKTKWKHAPELNHEEILRIYNSAIKNWKDVYENRTGHAEDMGTKHIINLIEDPGFRNRAFLVPTDFRMETAPRVYLWETTDKHAPVLFYAKRYDMEDYFKFAFKDVSKKALKLLVNAFRSLFRSHEEMEPTTEWLEEYRQRGKAVKVKLPYDMIMHQLMQNSWAQTQEGDDAPSFQHHRLKIGDLIKADTRVVWGLQSEKDKLATAKNILCYHHMLKLSLTEWAKTTPVTHYRIGYVAEDKAFIMFNIPNAIHVDKLLDGTDRVVGNIATAIKYKKRVEALGTVNLFNVYDHIQDKLTFLRDFMTRNHEGCDDDILYGIAAEPQFQEEFLEIVEEAGRINKEFVANLEEVEKYLKGAELLFWVSNDGEATLHIVTYLQAIHKHVNIEYYEGRSKGDQVGQESADSHPGGEEIRKESTT